MSWVVRFVGWMRIQRSSLQEKDVADLGFPVLAAGSWAHLARFLPWGEALVQP